MITWASHVFSQHHNYRLLNSYCNIFDTSSYGEGRTILRVRLCHMFRAEIHKYYEECDWSKKWAEGLQKILT